VIDERILRRKKTDQQPPVLEDAERGRVRGCLAGVPRELGSDRRPSSDPVETAIASAEEEGEPEDDDREVGEEGSVVKLLLLSFEEYSGMFPPKRIGYL
jgi:hypothetical protein